MQTLRIASISGILLTSCIIITLSGCGSGNSPPEVKSIPVYNPSPQDPLRDITPENEAANMDRIRGVVKGVKKNKRKS